MRAESTLFDASASCLPAQWDRGAAHLEGGSPRLANRLEGIAARIDCFEFAGFERLTAFQSISMRLSRAEADRAIAPEVPPECG